MHLRPQGHNRSLGWSCRECNAESSRRYRARCRQRSVTATLPRLLRADAERVVQLMNALLRCIGGWDRLRDSLNPSQPGELVVKMAISHDELVAKARDEERRENAQIQTAAGNRAMLDACVRILAELPPRELRPVMERLLQRTRDRRACVIHGCGEGI